MISKVISLITFSFLVGGCGLLISGIKNKDLRQNKNRWIKFVVYLLLVNFIVFSIQVQHLIRYLSMMIILIGLSELVYNWKKEKNSTIFLVCSLFIFSIIGSLFIGFSYYMPVNKQLLMYVFVFLFDGFSQVSGQLFGKHKLAPTISPNKSIEGATGGFISIIIVSYFISADVYKTDYVSLSFVPILIGLFALAGDLLASYYKRKCCVKDYSNLIPGHGGILDRFDSFIFSGALFWLLG